MFSSLRRMIGLIQVTEVGDQIKIAGLPGDMVQRDIVDLWGTPRIADNMFSHIGDSDVSFNRWFAPDVVYAFQKLIDEGSRKHNKRGMRRVIEHMYEHTWLKHTTENKPNILDFTKISLFKYPPLPHQDGFLRTYNWAVPRYMLKGYLLAAGPGTGKTYMGLLFAEMLHADIVVICCPKNAVNRVWYNSIAGVGEVEKDRLFKKVMPAWTSLMNWPPPKRGVRHFVVHFDAMEKFVEELKHLSYNRAVVLLDESHNLNDDESFRAEQFLKICQVTRSNHILWESGTPVKALGGEMATLFRSIDPMFDEDAQRRFKAIYGKASGKANDILAARLGRMTYKVESKAVVKAQGYAHERMIKIPEGDQYTLENVRVEMRKFVQERAAHYLQHMRSYERQYEEVLEFFYKTLTTPEQKKEYNLYRDYIKLIRKHYDPKALQQQAIYCNNYEKNTILPVLPREMRNIFKEVKSIVKYYKLKVQGEALGQILGKKRAECISAMVPHIGMEEYIDTAEKKTIIFTSYITVVDDTLAYLKKAGYKPCAVYGDTTSELASIVGAFERDQDLNPLVATFASLSTAVPLIMANEMIFLNQPFRSYERDQATARCVRQGQDRDVNIEDIFLDTDGKPNISTRTRDILMWSRQQVEEILNFKNPSFAMESFTSPLEGLPQKDYWIAMEEFLEDVDGFQDIAKWKEVPMWAETW